MTRKNAGAQDAGYFAAQVQDALVGGKDRSGEVRAAATALESIPGYKDAVTASGSFASRAVAHAAMAGISQFVDLGCGLPPARPAIAGEARLDTHEIALEICPDARVVYADKSPDVVHARALLVGNPRITIAEADLTEPDEVMKAVGFGIDWTQPMCLLLANVLHFFYAEKAYSTVGLWKQCLASGSRIIIAQAASNFTPGELASVRDVYQQADLVFRARSPATLRQFFTGCRMTDPATEKPGVVSVAHWGVRNPSGTGRPLIIGGTGTVPEHRR